MPRKPKSSQTIPLYDQVVRALGEEDWGVVGDSLPEFFEVQLDPKDVGEAKKLAAKIRRHKSDFPAFCEEVLRIRTKKGQLIPLELKKAQLHVWKKHFEPAFRENRPVRIYLLKGRQIGFSTLTQAIQYWRTSLWPFLSGLTAAHSTASASNIYGMLRLFYRNAPVDYRPMQKHANRNALYFAHSSDAGEGGLESQVVVATAADEDLGASYTLQMVHLSEFARYDQRSKDVDQIMATLMQAVPDDMASLVVAETTGEGDNFAADFWRRGTFTNVFIPWVADEYYRAHSPMDPNDLSADPLGEWGDEISAANYIREHLLEWNPEYEDDPEGLEHETLCRLKWRRHTLKTKCNGRIHLLHKQYPLTPEEAFSGGGKSIFDGARLSLRLNHLRKTRAAAGWSPLLFGWLPGAANPRRRFGPTDAGALRIYEMPDHESRYVIGVDVASGHEDGDYSVAQVFRLGEPSRNAAGLFYQVATFQAHIEPYQFANLLVDLSAFYDDAFLVPESTGIGMSVIEKLRDSGFNNMFLRKAAVDDLGQSYMEKWGFHTSPHTKPLLVSRMQDAIFHDQVQFNDEPTLEEMLAFTVDERGRYTAPKGKHDDTVIGSCLAIYGSVQIPEKADYRATQEDLEFEAFLRGETPPSRGAGYTASVM